MVPLISFWSGMSIYIALLNHYFIQQCKGQTCTAISGNSYNTISFTTPVVDQLTELSSCMNSSSMISCPAAPPHPPLIDKDLGPEGTNYTSSMVYTWHRSAQTVNITYTFNDNVTLQNVNLYFYSIPSMSIGLPDVTFKASVEGTSSYLPVEYYITGNGDISQQDSMRRNVILSLIAPEFARFYRICFDFLNTDVEWLVLSETGLCNSSAVAAPSMPPSLLPYTGPTTLSADDLSPNLTLSCTVMGEGRFSWQWTGPDGNPPSAVILSDVTRTSTAVFTNIRDTLMDTLAEETGERSATFMCEATYRPMVPDIENTAAQNITISLQETATTNMDQTTIAEERFHITEATSTIEETVNTTTEETTTNKTLLASLIVVFFLLLVGLVAGIVVILWRCKHHKHHHTVKEEASHTTSNSNPVTNLYEKTGQLQYASDQDNPSHTYSTLQHQGRKGRGGALEEIAMTEYNTLQSHANIKALDHREDARYSTIEPPKTMQASKKAQDDHEEAKYSTIEPPKSKSSELQAIHGHHKEVEYSTIEPPRSRGGGTQASKTQEYHKYSTLEPPQFMSSASTSKEALKHHNEAEYSTIEPPWSRGGGTEAGKMQEYHKYFTLEPPQSKSSETQASTSKEALEHHKEAEYSTIEPPQSRGSGTQASKTQEYHKYFTLDPPQSMSSEAQASTNKEAHEYSTIEPPQSRGGGSQASKAQEYHKYFTLEPPQSVNSVTQVSKEAQHNEEVKYSTIQPPQSTSGGSKRDSAHLQHYKQIDEVKTSKSGIKVDEKIISPALVGNSQSTVVNEHHPQVNKMKSIKDQVTPSIIPSSQPPEMVAEVDQLNTQVRKKKEEEVCPEESGAVYSVVNKPSPPQLPPKSQELLEEPDHAIQHF